MKIIKLSKPEHWQDYWISTRLPSKTLGLGVEYRIHDQIIHWLKKEKIGYFTFVWNSNMRIFFFKNSDAVRFKLTWG